MVLRATRATAAASSRRNVARKKVRLAGEGRQQGEIAADQGSNSLRPQQDSRRPYVFRRGSRQDDGVGRGGELEGVSAVSHQGQERRARARVARNLPIGNSRPGTAPALSLSPRRRALAGPRQGPPKASESFRAARSKASVGGCPQHLSAFRSCPSARPNPPRWARDDRACTSAARNAPTRPRRRAGAAAR